MLLVVWISLLGLAAPNSAAVTLVPPLSDGSQLSTPRPQNLSKPDINILTNVHASLPPDNVDPRFSYESRFANQVLDKNYAYLNSLLALTDLSTKGWTTRLSYDNIYSYAGYGDVTIRIHASQNPSSLQYRHAIWGVYSAIREAYAHNFRACVITLYWSPIVGKTRHVLGYVSILGAPYQSISVGNSTEDSLEHALPAQEKSLRPAIAKSGSTSNSSSSAITSIDIRGLRYIINLESKPLDIDAVFHTVDTGVVYLASWPQSQAIMQPGFVKDDRFRTFLRWDWSALDVTPLFEYRYAIEALSALPIYMYEQGRFREARIIIFVNEKEVGRGWLYKSGIAGGTDGR